MVCLRYAAFKGTSLVSRIIRFWTRSEYSHIAYMTADGELIECFNHRPWSIRWGLVDPPFKHHAPGTPCEIWELPVDEAVALRVDEFMHMLAEAEAPYDWLAVLGFVFKWKKEENGKYFCSEGCAAPLCTELEWTLPPWRISPDTFVALIRASGAVLVDSLEV